MWIGAAEDNQAWTQLLRARQTFDSVAPGVSDEQRRMAREELLIAEGSDWCWWYGPEHESPNRPEFDQLYRSHLANVYRFLNLMPPEDLSRPILRAVAPALHIAPSGPVAPVIDGHVTSYFEWIGAGLYRADNRSGSMHGREFLVHEAMFGSDGSKFYMRVDFHPGFEQQLSSMELRLAAQPLRGGAASQVAIALSHGSARVSVARLAVPAPAAASPIECAFGRVLEIGIALSALGVAPGDGLRFQFSLWQASLPMDAVPQQGWLEMPTTDPVEMGS